MKLRMGSVVAMILAFAAYCSADVIRFDDLNDVVSVTINGTPLTGNGGRVTNFVLSGETVSFDLTAPGFAPIAVSGFTNLLEVGNGDGDQTGAVSDRFLFVFNDPSATYHVVFGSDPNLPAIPGGAVDLTTIAAQGLPANPYFEDGTFQKVGSAFTSSGTVLDTFFARSDVTSVPEPASVVLLFTGIAMILVAVRLKIAR